MYDFCLIPALYYKIPALYAKIPDFYADIFLFGFHCDGNICGRVPIYCLWYSANDSARNERTKE